MSFVRLEQLPRTIIQSIHERTNNDQQEEFQSKPMPTMTTKSKKEDLSLIIRLKV